MFEDEREYVELRKCLYNLLLDQHQKTGHTNFDIVLSLPFNTSIHIESSQKRSIKTDIEGYINKKIEDTYNQIYKKDNFRVCSKEFLKLGIYNEMLTEITSLEGNSETARSQE